MRGMQCRKMLWLDKHKPGLRVIPPEVQARLDAGNEFGDRAMAMFGPYEEMTVYRKGTNIPDKKAMIRKTQEHLAKGTPVICEAAFSNYNNYCAADILRKTEAGYDLYEVKNAPEVYEQFVRDAGFQYYIISRCGVKIGRVFIALPFAYWGMQRGGMALGAAGALLGGTIAEGAALLYMLLQHKKADQALDFVPQRDGESPIASSIIAQRLIRVSIPITLGACIVPLAGFIDSIMLTQLMERAGMTAEDALVRYGSYAGPVLTLINVPTAIAMAMSTNLVPDIAAGLARGEKEYVAKEAGVGLRMAAVIGFPCSIGMSLLAQPILYLCYRGSYTAAQLDVAAELLRISSLTIVLFTMVQATSGILQGAGKQRIPMYTLVLGVALKIALNYTLVRIPGVDIHGAPWASLLCYTASMIPNLYYVSKYTGYRFNVLDVVVKPFGCAAVMGGAVYAIWTFGFGYPGHLNGFRLTAGIILCLIVGVVTYGFLALITKAVDKEDLPAKIRRFIK